MILNGSRMIAFIFHAVAAIVVLLVSLFVVIAIICLVVRHRRRGMG